MLERSKLNSIGLKPSSFRQCENYDLISLIPEDDNKYPKILALDTEDNSKGKTIMCNFFDGINHYTFRETYQAVDFLIDVSRRYKKGVEVWTANVAYDIANTFRETQEHISMTMAGSRVITAKIYLEKVKFKDILNVIPGASVKSLGKMINLEKLDHGNNFDNEEYCQRDTEIVYWSLLKYRQTLKNLNIELKNTAAATGFNALIKTFEQLQYNSFKEQDHEFLKDGYYGGRTEVFNTSIQKGEIYGYDITSSYPNVMRDIPIVDTRFKFYTKKPNFKKEGMVDLIIECPENILPYLPVRLESKLCFPSGVFRGKYTYFEIRKALKLGYKIIEIKQALEFKNTHDITLSKFIDKIFKMRLDAKKKKDKVMDYACKIILNASYGKFALGNEKTELIAFEELSKVKGNFFSEIFPNNQVLVKKTTTYSLQTNYLTASLITAHARHNLYHFLNKASQVGTILYCDTDSVFYKGPKLKDIKSDGSLGSLNLEHELIEAQFILPKTYYLKWKNNSTLYKCKGVKNDLAEKFFKEGHASWVSPLKYVETCRKNFQISERNKKNKGNTPFIPFNMWVDKPKSLKSKYDKRKILQRGETEPLKVKYDIETNENVI